MATDGVESVKRNIALHSSATIKINLITLSILIFCLFGTIPMFGMVDHIGTRDFHAAIEMVGALIGLIAGFAIISYCIEVKNRFYLLIGLAFFINAAEDFIHGLMVFEAVHAVIGLPASSLKEFIPGTYVTGRIMMAVILISAPFLVSRLLPAKLPQEPFFLTVIVIFVAVAGTVIAYHIDLPAFIHPDQLISRPVDFLSGALLFIALILYCRRYLLTREMLIWWIILSISINMIGQFTMSLSSQLYDVYFDMAHVYKVVGYSMPLIGFTLFQTKLLSELIIAESRLSQSKDALEETVEKRTQELTQNNAELERFTYTVSHDLKSPLITIQGFSDLLEKDIAKQDSKRIKGDLHQITQAAEKMKNLLDDLLELSRIGRLINPSERIAVKTIIDDVVLLMHEVITKAAVRIELKIEDNLPIVCIDRTQIGEVFQNLIENAVKFTREQRHPVIEVSASFQNGHLLCYVKDNGIGIDPAYQEKVFGLFEKLNKEQEGTGIGLAIVKRIVEFHGGKIWIESDGLGTGSVFYFTLPTSEKDMKNEND